MNSSCFGISTVVTVGSEFQVTAPDYLRFFDTDDRTVVIGVVLYRAGLRVGTSVTEGTANFPVNRRMNKLQQMRWSRRDADLPLQVRCTVFLTAASCSHTALCGFRNCSTEGHHADVLRFHRLDTVGTDTGPVPMAAAAGGLPAMADGAWPFPALANVEGSDPAASSIVSAGAFGGRPQAAAMHIPQSRTGSG